MVIRFNDVDEAHGFLSNCSPHSFEFDGYFWRSNTHFYHAQKFTDNPQVYQMVHTMDTPKSAKNMAQSYNPRPDWCEVRDGVMRRGVGAKFTHNYALLEQLLATGDEILEYGSPSDAYWGLGPAGDGLNMLGRILMEVRFVVRAAEDFGSDVHFMYAAREWE